MFRVRDLAAPAVLTFNGYASSDEQRVTQQTTTSVDPSNVDTASLGALLNIPWVVPADERGGVRESCRRASARWRRGSRRGVDRDGKCRRAVVAVEALHLQGRTTRVSSIRVPLCFTR